MSDVLNLHKVLEDYIEKEQIKRKKKYKNAEMMLKNHP